MYFECDNIREISFPICSRIAHNIFIKKDIECVTILNKVALYDTAS